MFGDLAALTSRWMPLVAVISLPFLLSLVAVLWQRYQLNRLEREYEPLPTGTGRFVQHTIERKLLPLDVGMHPDPHSGGDGYWPGVGFIALTEGTWKKRFASSWAVGAHEMGHAVNIGGNGWLEIALPMARLASSWASQAFAAILLVAALYGSAWALWAAFAVAVFAMLMSGIILADEGMASVNGYRLLREDGRLDEQQMQAARESLMDAFTVYLAQFVGRVAILASWGFVMSHVLGGPAFHAAAPGAAGVWLAIIILPVLFLRVAHVAMHVLQPEQVRSEFRLATIGNTEARWEFLTGIGVLLLVWQLHGLSDHPAFIGAVTLAAVPAMGPVAALGRIPVLLPVVLVVRSLLREGADNEIVGEWMREEHVPGAMAVPAPVLDFHNNPPLYLRGSWLLKITFVPLLVGLVVGLIAG